MRSNLYATFSYEFWLTCFQEQSCSLSQKLSNNRLQAYIKMNMRSSWLQKISKHMLPLGTSPTFHKICFLKNFICSLGNFSCSLGNFIFLHRELTLFLGASCLELTFSLFSPKEVVLEGQLIFKNCWNVLCSFFIHFVY